MPKQRNLSSAEGVLLSIQILTTYAAARFRCICSHSVTSICLCYCCVEGLAIVTPGCYCGHL